MRSAEFTRLTKRMQGILMLLWLALMMSVALYVVIAYMQTREFEPVDVSPSVLLVLSSLASVAAVLAVVLPRWMLSDARLETYLRSPPRPATATQGFFAQVYIADLPDAERRLAGLCMPYSTGFIMGMALSEAVAVFGLILTFLSHNLVHVLPFAAVALVLMLGKRPNVHALLERGQRLANPDQK